MSKNLRLKILKYIKSKGGEYEVVDFTPIIIKSVDKVDRKNIKSVLKDLNNEGFIDADWRGLSFSNNVDGSMKSLNEINAKGRINQKGLSYLLEDNLKRKQTIHVVISSVSIILTLFLLLYGQFVKSEILKLKDINRNLEKRIIELEKNQPKK